MREQEAAWIEATLAALPTRRISPLLDIGTANARHRTVDQPWIERRVFAPLAARGVATHFADIAEAPGVDVAADIATDAGLDKLRALDARVILCCNVLEHVPDAAYFARRLSLLANAGTRLVVTVPHRYPHHRDPIDTMFRPNVAALAELFPDCEMERAAIVQAGSYREAFKRRPVTLLLRHLTRLPVPFIGWRAWKRSVSKLQYLVRPYEITCACFVKKR